MRMLSTAAALERLNQSNRPIITLGESDSFSIDPVTDLADSYQDQIRFMIMAADYIPLDGEAMSIYVDKLLQLDLALFLCQNIGRRAMLTSDDLKPFAVTVRRIVTDLGSSVRLFVGDSDQKYVMPTTELSSASVCVDKLVCLPAQGEEVLVWDQKERLEFYAGKVMLGTRERKRNALSSLGLF